MKKIIAVLLSFLMVFTGCGKTTITVSSQPPQENYESIAEESYDELSSAEIFIKENPDIQLDDKEFLTFIEGLVYEDTITNLDSDEYFVEGVNAVYISKEYIEEVMFNSQENVFFGYNLQELNEIFQDKKYIFTLGENGLTTVKELEKIDDNTTGTMIKNVAVGSGVILVCVTVSAVTAGTGAPAVSMIFAASASTAAKCAVSSAVFGAVTSAAVTGIQTNDVDKAFESAALSATEGFKWGAISGAVVGGAKAKETFSLHSATKNGLTLNEAAKIQKESKLPTNIISEMHSFAEYEVYKGQNLKPLTVNGKTALVSKIDLNYTTTNSDGTKITNLEKMLKGQSPIDPVTKTAYELHHIGQKNDATLAVLPEKIHKEFTSVLHISGKESEIGRPAFAPVRAKFWKSYAKYLIETGGT